MENELIITNPGTLKPVGKARICGQKEIEEALGRAKKDQKIWAMASFEERVRCLRRLRQLIIDRHDKILDTIRAETAKVIISALTETLYVCGAIDFFCNNLPAKTRPRRVPVQLPFFNKLPVITYKPIPIVGMITPWNLPFTLTLGEAIPYLLMGSAVILKPSEYTPLSALLAEELCATAGIPRGIFQVITGDGKTGAALVESQVDSVVFTGSAKTGRKIAETCGQLLKPCSLELGGKTPFLILQENNPRNIERAIMLAVWSAFKNSGQYCKSTANLYVHTKHADSVIFRINEETQRLVAGRDYGPLITEFQLQIIIDQVEDARSKHAYIWRGCGGKIHPELGGRWYMPTVLLDVNDQMRVMTEEIFGPILTITVVKSDEEMIELANGTRYGLNAVVCSSDIDYARQVAARLSAGTVTINDALINYMIPSLPYGGVKDSGWGRHHGLEGELGFATQQSLLIHRFGVSPWPDDIWWFPYSDWKVKLIKNLVHFNRFFANWLGGN